jgi:short-subunit dehydrogenase
MSENKTALITGASAGLGRDFARLFASDGNDTVLVARRRDRLDELAAELRAGGVRATVIAEDLAAPEAPIRIADRLAADGIEVEFLVNNAGFGTTGSFAEIDLGRELEMIQVNITALVHLTGLLLPAMVARGNGRILNVGSTAGFQPGPGMATYYASKAFVNHFTEGLAHELKETGVTATVSCPGATATEFGEVAGNAKSILFRMGAASSQAVAREAYDAMMAGKPMVVHGLTNKLAMESLRLSPRAVVRALVANLNKTS